MSAIGTKAHFLKWNGTYDVAHIMRMAHAAAKREIARDLKAGAEPWSYSRTLKDRLEWFWQKAQNQKAIDNDHGGSAYRNEWTREQCEWDAAAPAKAIKSLDKAMRKGQRDHDAFVAQFNAT